MTRRVRLLTVLILAGATILPRPSLAQASNGTLKLDQADLSVPESPAFTVLGVTPEQVVRPADPRKLATSLLNGLDRNGNLQSGVAIDLAPYLFTKAGKNLNLATYRDSYTDRLLARTQVSIATAKGTGSEDKAIRLALGLHLIPFDAGDPRMDQKMLDALIGLGEKMTQNPPPSPEEIRKEYRQILKDHREGTWNRPQFLIGAAPSWISKTGNSGDLGLNGYGVWASYGYGFNNTNQLIFHVRHRDHEEVPNPDVMGSFIHQDTTLVGARYRTGSPDSAISLETVYTFQKPQGKKTDEFVGINLALEQKLTDDLWLGLLLGGETGRRNGNRINFGATFKWGYSNKPQLVK